MQDDFTIGKGRRTEIQKSSGYISNCRTALLRMGGGDLPAGRQAPPMGGRPGWCPHQPATI